MLAIARKALYCCHVLASNRRNQGDAGVHRPTIEMNRSRAAAADAAAKLGARETQLVAQYPKERHIARDIDGHLILIDHQAYWHQLTFPRRV